MNKTIKQLELELALMKNMNRNAWDEYGSELCAGDMLRREKELEEEIYDLRKKEKFRNGTIKRWEDSGLLKDPMMGITSSGSTSIFGYQETPKVNLTRTFVNDIKTKLK